MKKTFTLSAMALSVLMVGCSDSDNATKTASLTVPETYTFTSQFDDFDGESSVSYSGQTARQVLIDDLKTLITSTEITNLDDRQAVIDKLNSLYSKEGSDIDSTPYLFSKTDAVLTPSLTYGDISTDKDIKGKIAGEDNALRNVTLKGWATGLDADPTSDEFIQYLFGLLADNVVSEVQRTNPIDESAEPEVLDPHVTVTGVNLQQLIQKFLLMAVTYSQGTGDYLSSDLGDGKGINSSADQKVKEDVASAYSSLEHSWDEGFGYFGAARNYNNYTDLEIRAKSGRDEYNNGYHDFNGDGLIDLKSEVNFAASVNAAKRDVGSAETAQTDFTKTVFDAFLKGRALITQHPEGYLTELVTQRDIIVNNWEKAYAATIVHYINEVLVDMGNFDTEAYSFTNHAKHWSEMKGFALGLQFNPNALMNITDFTTVNTLFGDQPVLPNATVNDIAQYKTDLLSARAIFKASYDFADANIGDTDGTNGW